MSEDLKLRLSAAEETVKMADKINRKNQQQIHTFTKQLQIAREALEYYGKREKYLVRDNLKAYGRKQSPKIYCDMGSRARQALTEMEKHEKAK